MAQKKNKKRIKKTSSGAWFIPVRGSYLPASGAGWLTYIPFVGYLVLTFVIAYNDISSHLLAIFFVIPNWVAAAAIMTFIASRHA
jgi:hypothetical protein